MACVLPSYNFDDTELRSLFMDKEEREKVFKAMKERKAKRSDKDNKDKGATDCENEMKKSSEDANAHGKSTSDKEGDQNSSGEHEAEPRIEWSVGDNCRAMYSEDLMFYEAVITEIVDEDTFKIKFLGYDNEELEKREFMMQSKGRAAQQMQQIDSANQFEVGSFCRALYKDNKWYEAIIVRFVVQGDGEEKVDDGYVVKFLGYEGESHVYELRPSWGPRARRLQEAVADQEVLSSVGEEDSDEDNCEDIVSMCGSGIESESGVTVSERQGHRKHSSKPSASARYSPRARWDVSVRSTRDQASSNRRGCNPCCSTWEPQNECRIRGPSTCCCSNAEDQALNTLLMSWYMAGYYAGTNQGRLSRRRRTCCSCGH